MFFKSQKSYRTSAKGIFAICCAASIISCGTDRLERVVSVKGEQGEQGEPGIDGRDGVDGRDGRQIEAKEPQPEFKPQPYPMPYPKPEPYPMPYPRPEPYPMPYPQPQPQQPPQQERIFTVCVCIPKNQGENCWWPKPQPQDACLYTTMSLRQEELLNYKIVHHGPCR